ncbi:hypothetical protein LY01_02760 [Nonlabens xylanidelens]|uniref:Uncharacterized protein n=1 Tax=Nonlabens xylanidelens TaxID=191564 RepID=A0A2S6IFQ9_9FLAO|nr:hypothetical protein [Nonlabens xylanidelens]PPK93055.1 hypothetical protein LY01_02760 [Nonlabens xylanidelens]PQJ18740.1 hypothetical protein BST94_06900 [Nonlabens xylanidelens]
MKTFFKFKKYISENFDERIYYKVIDLDVYEAFKFEHIGEVKVPNFLHKESLQLKIAPEDEYLQLESFKKALNTWKYFQYDVFSHLKTNVARKYFVVKLLEICNVVALHIIDSKYLEYISFMSSDLEHWNDKNLLREVDKEIESHDEVFHVISQPKRNIYNNIKDTIDSIGFNLILPKDYLYLKKHKSFQWRNDINASSEIEFLYEFLLKNGCIKTDLLSFYKLFSFTYDYESVKWLKKPNELSYLFYLLNDYNLLIVPYRKYDILQSCFDVKSINWYNMADKLDKGSASIRRKKLFDDFFEKTFLNKSS